jgi:hypothetical protein
VDLSLQLTAFLVSKLFCKKVEIAIYILGSSLLNNQYSLSELFKYGKLLHKICISFTKRHLSLMYKGHSNRMCKGKLTTFYKIKETFSREFYLDSLCFKQRSILTKFRLSAHSLRIETGRYEKCRDEGGNVKQK